MKRKNLIWFALAVAILGLGLWWFTRPTVVAPNTIADVGTSASSKVAVPRQFAPPAITPPVASLATKPDSAPAAVPPPVAESPPNPNADPQADLKTALPDIVRLLREGDRVGAYKTYCPPDELNPRDIQQMQELLMQSLAAAAQDPGLQQLMQKNQDEFSLAFEALEDQTPTYNDAGDEATYKFANPSEGEEPLTFVKIDGKWYIKQIARK